MERIGIILVVIVLFIFIELDKKIYEKLEDEYKKIILKDKYKEGQQYYNSNNIIQFIKNVENHTKGSAIYKSIGFIALLVFIFVYDKIDKNYSMMILRLVGTLIFCILTILCVYNLIKGLKDISEYKKQSKKENVSLEILYVALHSSYFFIVIVIFYIQKVIL